MRAREFITEDQQLPPEQADPMSHVFVLPGVKSSDPYQIYRLGVAMARARSDAGTQDPIPYMPIWSAQAAFGEEAVIAGFNGNVAPVIDQALKMAGLPGGKVQVSTPNSIEPASVDTTSPVKGFKGYPR
jgi:hypothetical protein